MSADSATGPSLLDRIIDAYEQLPGVQQKAEIGLVSEVLGASDWLAGPGDDAAAVPFDDEHVLAAGEAMWPPFVETDPFGAGIGAVVANVNDIAAMGGRCLGIIDTIVGPKELAREALQGMAAAAQRYKVPILGGHLTVRSGPPALSAFAVGRARSLLASRNAAAGHALLFATCLDGVMRPDLPFFRSFESRGDRLPGDVALLPELAESGDCVAAKDVSMAGLLGSTAMLLEPSGCGVTIDLDVLPVPEGAPIEHWLSVFPSYGFLLCAPSDRVEATVARFLDRGLTCAQIGVLDDSGSVRVRAGTHERTVTAVDGITGITFARAQ